MALLQFILGTAIIIFTLAVITCIFAKPVLKNPVRFADGSLAAILMVMIGGLAAILFGRAYIPVRPTLTGFFAQKYQVFGWWIDLDLAIIWTCGLAIGYAIALTLVLRKQIPSLGRLAVLSALTALSSPFIAFGADYALNAGASVIIAAIPH